MKQILLIALLVGLTVVGHFTIASFDSYLIMIGLISFLVIAHELGHFYVAKKVGVKVERFGFGLPFGPTLLEYKVGETTFCVHMLLLGGYVSFPDDDPDSDVPVDSPRRFENKTVAQRSAIAVAGVTVNFILGYLLVVLVLAVWGYPSARTGVEKLMSATSPAAIAGLLPGDMFVSVAGKTVKEPDTLISTLGDYKQQPVALVIKRGTEQKTLMVTPNQNGKIEVALKPIPYYEPFKNPVEIPGRAYMFLQEKMLMNFQAMGEIFTGKRSVKELSGPVGIIGQGGKAIHDQGLPIGLIITALISVILAVMNILPVPMLDGGHLLFMMIEKIQGHPLKKEIQERVVQASFVVMMGLMVFILWNDVSTHLLGH